MDGTPRLRSAFPATPQRSLRESRDRRSNPFQQLPRSQQKPLPTLPPSYQSTANEPLIPEHIVDAPSQRLYAVAFWVALWTWRLYDFFALQESEEQSLWLFMKWVAIDGIFLFGLPGLRIPWLEWSSSTMTLIFLAHAFLDGILMFRIPIPIGATMAVLWRGVWGYYETAVNENNVNPDTVRFNDSLILGRQVIHILPEGSAILNLDRAPFCLDATVGRTEVTLPITINSTNPISMDIVRFDLDRNVNETLQISKSQIRTMHKEASRLLSYSDNPNEPKTLYYTVKKPGVYILAKVVDETNLEVARKQLAHTVVVQCPKAVIRPTAPNKCKGELSDIGFEVTGTPPMRVKYHKMINQVAQEATFESIQPEDLISPLQRLNQNALVVPNKVEAAWARAQTVKVSMNESLGVSGRWAYAIDEVTDGFGNKMVYSKKDQNAQENRAGKSPQLYQVVTVHERPVVSLDGCSPQRPLKVAEGETARLPVRYGSSGRGELLDTAHHLEYIFSPLESLSSAGEHDQSARVVTATAQGSKQMVSIREAGLYTLSGVSTDFCSGEVLEPKSCLLQNPPKPQLNVSSQAIFDKCAGSPIGLRVDLNLIGTPPFKVHYRTRSDRNAYHHDEYETITGLRGQIELTPKEAGRYVYTFLSVSDAVYKQQTIKDVHLTQAVKPAANAEFVDAIRRVTCIDQSTSFNVHMVGEGPFALEYELVHGGKRSKYVLDDLEGPRVELRTPTLNDGGDYTVALVSITDSSGCKEFLDGEAKIAVRHQKPKVGFGHIDGKRSVDTFEGKKVDVPLRLSGEGPWTVKFQDARGGAQTIQVTHPNDKITVTDNGVFELLDVRDAVCPGTVDELAKQFQVNRIPRPALRIIDKDIIQRSANHIAMPDVCEGDDDVANLEFEGAPPFHVIYEVSAKLDHGTVAPKKKDARAALHGAGLRMDTTQSGHYEYILQTLADSNYEPSKKHFQSIKIEQTVHARPSAAFKNPGKTYGFCSVESEGEEVVPVKLHGKPPFELEVEIKHHGTIKPELVQYTNIESTTHNIHIPHSRLHLGKSAILLRRVGDARGCTRSLDSTTPRVQISVHDAPTITPMENQVDYCVGQHINFGLSGVAPFQVFYTFEGAARKATVSKGNAFRRLAEKPGTFIITGVQDSASSCRSAVQIEKRIHGMPSVRVSKGRDSYVDIHEGGEAEILFEFGGSPPFEFTYTRSSNTEKGGKKGSILDMKTEVSEERELRVLASQEGTYEVISIKDRHCAYQKPGVKVDRQAVKMLGY